MLSQSQTGAEIENRDNFEDGPVIGAVAFDAVTLSDIQSLVDLRIPEGRAIEYKRDHYGRTDADKREFAADVCALANAGGGDLLIGGSVAMVVALWDALFAMSTLTGVRRSPRIPARGRRGGAGGDRR
jgi:hypothetical protein